MLYDATAALPLMALEDLGFVARGDSGGFVADGHTSVGGEFPVNTNGGGLNYTHSGMYGTYALLESVRQLRGEAAAQVDGVSTSLTHAIGGMFQAAATAILSTQVT
jgi:acetyl-CoA acetyltransferase